MSNVANIPVPQQAPPWFSPFVRGVEQAIQWAVRAPSIGGGTINNAVIGGTTPAAGTFTTLSITQGAVLSGTYTPTLFNVTNVAASTAYACQYMRVGNVVNVSGKVDVDPTLTAATVLGISLPIASTLSAAEKCAGIASSNSIASEVAAIDADTVNNRAQMEWVTVSLANHSMFFDFQYLIT